MIVAAETVHRHVSQDLLFVVVSIGLAVVGSFAALVSAIRIPLSEGRLRARWTVAAAVSLGGGGIWSMHFIGMIGYHVDGFELRYDLPITVLSLLIAVVGSALGISLVARRPRSVGWLLLSGLVAGLGVAAMHYTGMAAMHVGATVTYRPEIVALSIAIAVAAAVAALWIAFRVRTIQHVALASLVMAAAVCGMHYTAMAATQVTGGSLNERVQGADSIVLAPIVCVIAFSILAVVIFSALGGVTESSPLSRAGDGNGRFASSPGPEARDDVLEEVASQWDVPSPRPDAAGAAWNFQPRAAAARDDSAWGAESSPTGAASGSAWGSEKSWGSGSAWDSGSRSGSAAPVPAWHLDQQPGSAQSAWSSGAAAEPPAGSG
ncbi:MHYT domain-containing protein [Frankia sp. AgKG'84/4]|uniref:MHYT domain-containing protein n=1 Tax=Frankia sp. AgKG'84/4 TaxID=573490 RepID=UPI00202A63BE|nr:MHYT domain-containing protein [Frankia sp. AgKG'84/4]MCL9798164.1 histidine kinase [Frankia sp. AgKG'84/4]